MASVTDADQDHARLSLTKLAIPPTATTPGLAEAHAPLPNLLTDELKSPARPSLVVAAAAAVAEVESDLRPDHDRKRNHEPERDDASSLHTPVDTVTSSATSSCIITSPPYWPSPARMRDGAQTPTSTRSSHGHPQAPTQTYTQPAGAITLRDNDTPDDDRNSACWAKSVEVPGHTLVGGSALTSNIGAFVVWNIRVETLNGSYLHIRKRYSEFDEFRGKLVATFPGFQAAMPKLPPKSLVYKLKPEFLEKRRAGLEYFLNCVLLNPEFSGSPVLKDFLFA